VEDLYIPATSDIHRSYANVFVLRRTSNLYIGEVKQFLPTILKFAAIFFVVLLIQFWLFDYSDWKIPETIPNTNIQTSGLLIVGALMVILTSAGKQFLKISPSSSVTKLTLAGALIGFFSEFAFQIIRAFTFDSDCFRHFWIGTLSTSACYTLIAFFESFQLKTKRTGMLILYIVILIIVGNIMLYFFPDMFKPGA